MFAWKKNWFQKIVERRRQNYLPERVKVQYVQDFTKNCQEYLYYSKQGVFGNDHIKICWQITVLEKEKDKINLLKESKFSIKIFPGTTNHIFIIQSKEY